MDLEDLEIEKELVQELQRISLSCLDLQAGEDDDDDEEEEGEEPPGELSEAFSDELPESILRCLHYAKTRAEDAEKLILEDLEDTDTLISNRYKVPHHTADILAELASEYNEDPETLKKRILAEVEEQGSRELQLSLFSDTNIVNIPQDNVFVISDYPESSTLDRGDMAANFDYIEVEERCRKDLQLWEERQKQLEADTRCKLQTEKEIREKKMREEEERRRCWQEEFENERKRLEIVQTEQQAKLEEEEEKKKKSLAGELKQHEELINRLQQIMEEEKKTFEEQKEKARRHLEEMQYKAATKIQANVRAFLAYRTFAPKIKELRSENKKKKELEVKMEQERKAAEAKIKRKLEEKKQKEEERTRKAEEERKRLDEIKRQESLKLERRRLEYEKKKEAEKQRHEKERQLKLEALKQDEERKQKEEAARKCLEKNERTIAPENQSILRTAQEQGASKEHVKEDQVPRQELEQKVQKAKEDKKKGTENGTDETKLMVLVTLGTKEPIIPTTKANEQQEHPVERKGDTIKNVSLKTANTQDHNMETEPKMKEDIVVDNKLDMASNNVISQIKATNCTQEVEGIQPTNKDVNHWQSIKPEVLKSDEHVPLTLGNHSLVTSENESQENIPRHLQSDYKLVLPDHIEEKRLAWMRTCIPWSKVMSENQRTKVMKKSRPRKISAANKMLPLNADIILRAGSWRALNQVTTVTLEDLPGCSLSTLSECSKLQSLNLRRCGLTALEGLSNCKELKFIDVQENNIQVINCEGLENLCVILLNNNRLTSIHGLDGCANLKNLELSYNKITRIGGFEGLRNLQRLIIDHNQLISTKGLEATPTLMYLDCSFNHLTELEGIQKCGLLQILMLQGNNLSKPPVLENQVLLRELHLDDNSVTALEIISSCWLPLLQIISLSQNSLIQLAPLSTVVSLEKLDISNNCLSDLQSVLAWLNGCQRLCELSLNGNPLLQDADWKCSLMKTLPCLKILNDEAIVSEEKTLEERFSIPRVGSFLAFCRAQIQELNLLNQRYDRDLGVACSSLEIAQIHCRYYDELLKLANEHRFAHEYGVLNVNESHEPETQTYPLTHTASDNVQYHQTFTGEEENKRRTSQRWSISKEYPSTSKHSSNDCQLRSEEEEHTIGTSNRNQENKYFMSPHVKKESLTELGSESTLGQKQLHGEKNIQHSAATIIQRHWRGYAVRRDIRFYFTLNEAAVVIQKAWRKFFIRRTKTGTWIKEKKSDRDTSECRHKAATRIQACWKGYYLRRKLSAALAAIAIDELDDEFEEVNLDDFAYDEAVLEKEWLALDYSSLNSKTFLLPDQLRRPKNSIFTPASMPPMLPWHPHQAWQCDEVSHARTICTPGRKEFGSRSPSTRLSGRSDLKRGPEGVFKSGKEEIISEEWGFKDVTTAQLMIRRAQKMKSKQAKTRKLLNPAVRLALFRNNENKHVFVKPPRKIQPSRLEYFRGREEEFSSSDKVPPETVNRRKELTYQWLHTQCGDDETPSSRTMKCNRFLPELDPEILNGGRVQLVASLVSREAMDLELVSMTSGSALTQNNSQPHRHSAGSAHGDTPATAKTPVRKERISMRDNPVNLSGGWGGGKKRAKTFK